MAYTRRQKLMMAVLAAALGGLALDWLVLREGDMEPSSAQAQSADRAFDGPAAPQAPSAGDSDPAARADVARLLQDYATRQGAAGPVDDAFQPDEDWRAQLRQHPGRTDTAEARAQAFLKAHRLSSVVCSSPAQSTALVDGRVMKVGDWLEDFQLVSLGPDSAVFAQQGLSVVLTISRAEVKP